MARYRDPSCKLCRREKTKLFLKGDRCLTGKCAMERREFPPGEHGHRSRFKVSDYAVRLREKQKLRRMYGVLERQFARYFAEAERAAGPTGENLVRLLETRLDNIIYRLGFAPSRAAARQLVVHRHFLVNGRIVRSPSRNLRPGDVVEVRERSRKLYVIKDANERAADRELLSWLEVDREAMRGKLLMAPSREAMPVPVEEQLVVELYSK